MAKLKRRDTSKESLQKVIEKAIDKKQAVEIDIESIKHPKYHDRKYIDKHSIYELSQSIKATKGLIYPIVVRELKDGTLERLIGYRRIEAYKLLDKKKIPAIILQNVSDKQALLLMTTENMQRENLSLYDETLALVDYLAVSLDIEEGEVLKLLNRIKNYKNGVLVSNITDTEKKKYFEIEEILAKTGKITVSTLINRVKQTNVKPILKDSLSKGEITFAVAQILNKIDDEELIKKTIKETIEMNLSKREVQKLLSDSLPKQNDSELKKELKSVGRLKLNELEQAQRDEIRNYVKKILEVVKK